jgi:hypothetical protein
LEILPAREKLKGGHGHKKAAGVEVKRIPERLSKGVLHSFKVRVIP